MLAVFQHSLTTTSVIMMIPTVVLIIALGPGKEAFRADYPQDIQQLLSAPTAAQRRSGILWGALFMVSLILAMTATTWLFLTNHDADIATTYLVALLAEIVFLIYDLVIVDWLVICTMKPRWVLIPGTEHCAGWSDYGFHFKQLLQLKVLAANVLIAVLPAVLAFALHSATSTH